MSAKPDITPLNAVYLAQARSLPGLLERLMKATPPDSLERCELVARIENLLELFEPAVEDIAAEPPGWSSLHDGLDDCLPPESVDAPRGESVKAFNSDE